MKKGLLSSYISGLTDFTHGESYQKLLGYFSQEFVSAVILYSVLSLVDSYFIGWLKDTSTFATLGVTNTLLHFITKIAEGVSVGVLVLTGQLNGAGKFQEVGRVLIDSFWVAAIVGASIALMLYSGAYYVYWLFGVPEDIINIGIPFLRLRAIGVFFTFVYFAFLGFLRGIKNTRTPMKIFMVGGVLYVALDYALIFGKFGFPEMGYMGSALASAVQYGTMMVIAFCYLFFKKETKRYAVSLFAVLDRHYFKELFFLSWPVVLDKATYAAATIWLCKMVAPMGKYILATFSTIKDMERIAVLPAVAFAQVITFLVSNDMGNQQWDAIKGNIKKTIFLAGLMVIALLSLFSLYPSFFVQIVDRKGEFTHLVARIFPLLSILITFDLLQLILSGALRGAANVKFVMVTRIVVFICYFMPVSYWISTMALDNVIKFISIFSSFYIANAIMSFIYIYWFRGEGWKKQAVNNG